LTNHRKDNSKKTQVVINIINQKITVVFRDKKGDLKWDDGTTEVCVAERDISPKRSKKSKSTGNTSQSKMDDTLLVLVSII
jgi:hypothetical protein